MKKLLFSIILIITLASSSVYAETVKLVDKNRTITDEEFMKQWEQLEKDKKQSKVEASKTKADLEASKKRGKDLDELINQLDTNKKK
jgi:uncharacterized protein YxeA